MSDNYTNELAERTVLGAILLDNSVYSQVAQVLKPEDFYTDTHRKVFIAIGGLLQKGKTADLVTLSNGKVEGATFLSSLTDGLPHKTNAQNYAEIVHDMAVRRRLRDELNRSLKSLDGGPTAVTTEGCVSEIQKFLLEMQSNDKGKSPEKVEKCLDNFYSGMEKMRNFTGECLGFTTGFTALDKATTGYRKGEITVIGAWPSRGKTALAVQGAVSNAMCGVPTGFFSLEMRSEQLIGRALCFMTGIAYQKFRDPRKFSAEEWATVKSQRKLLDSLPLFIDDSASLDAYQIAARARLLFKRDKVKLIFVDYIQRVRGKGQGERERLNSISYALAEFSKNEGVPVIVLSQLARPNDSEADARPTMFMLKESGNIEADADNVLLLHRPKEKKGGSWNGLDEVIIGKQRAGYVGSVKTWFDGDAQTFKARE